MFGEGALECLAVDRVIGIQSMRSRKRKGGRGCSPGVLRIAQAVNSTVGLLSMTVLLWSFPMFHTPGEIFHSCFTVRMLHGGKCLVRAPLAWPSGGDLRRLAPMISWSVCCHQEISWWEDGSSNDPVVGSREITQPVFVLNQQSTLMRAWRLDRQLPWEPGDDVSA